MKTRENQSKNFIFEQTNYFVRHFYPQKSSINSQDTHDMIASLIILNKQHSPEKSSLRVHVQTNNNFSFSNLDGLTMMADDGETDQITLKCR